MFYEERLGKGMFVKNLKLKNLKLNFGIKKLHHRILRNIPP